MDSLTSVDNEFLLLKKRTLWRKSITIAMLDSRITTQDDVLWRIAYNPANINQFFDALNDCYVYSQDILAAVKRHLISKNVNFTDTVPCYRLVELSNAIEQFAISPTLGYIDYISFADQDMNRVINEARALFYSFIGRGY